MATEDIYERLGVGGYNPTYQAPEDIVNRIASFQRSQRAAPFASEIQSAGQGYSQAAPDVQAQKRARANQLRQAFVAAGGRPDDLPKELWGSSPDQGFQIGDGQFHIYTPSVEDNMTYAQKTQRAAITGLFENKPTQDAINQLVNNQYKEAQIKSQQQKQSATQTSKKTTSKTTSKTAPTVAQEREKDVDSLYAYYEDELPNNFASRGKGIDDYAAYLTNSKVAPTIIKDIGQTRYNELVRWVNLQVKAAGG